MDAWIVDKIDIKIGPPPGAFSKGIMCGRYLLRWTLSLAVITACAKSSPSAAWPFVAPEDEATDETELPLPAPALPGPLRDPTCRKACVP